jgi:hypothetical protein
MFRMPATFFPFCRTFYSRSYISKMGAVEMDIDSAVIEATDAD